MISRTLHRWLTVPAKRTRGLAFLLLACFSWGATAEVAHHHGNQTPSAQRQLSTSIDQSQVSRIESNRSNGSSRTSKSQNDCLICQLHQNLSATDISYSHCVAPVIAQVHISRTSASPNQFGFPLNTQGRAPPVNLYAANRRSCVSCSISKRVLQRPRRSFWRS